MSGLIVSEEGKLARELRSLRIERNDRPKSRPLGRLLALSLSLVLGAGVSAVLLAPELGDVEKASETAMLVANTDPDLTPLPQSDWVVAGYVVARRQSFVSTDVTATVAELLVDEGAIVQKGQVIARLDGALAEADLHIAEARADAAAQAVAAVQAELTEAERALERTRDLSARSISSGADLDKAEARVAALTARAKEAQARRLMAMREAERAGAVLAKHVIASPFTGTVVGCSAQVGETISPMSSGGSIRNGICTIIDAASIEIELDVPETMIRRITLGAKAEAFLDAFSNDGLPVFVHAVAPTANREKSTIKVRLRFERMNPRLRPDMAIKVNFLDFPSGGDDE